MGTYRILSIDGGGIRGVVAAKLLQQIEEEYLQGSSLHDSFDMFVGTSTGAVIAAAIANNQSIDNVIDLYKDRNPELFAGLYYRLLRHLDVAINLRIDRFKAWLGHELKPIAEILRYEFSAIQSLLLLLSAWRPKYDARNRALKQVMQQELGPCQPTFEEIRETKRKHLVITSYDTVAREKFIFDSEQAEFDDIPVSTAAFCSSSAPTFFPAKQFATKQERCLIDGGLVANNPVTIAIAHALAAGRKAEQAGDKGILPTSIDEIQVLSIGTGDPTRSISFSQAKGWGLLQWASRLPDIFFDGASETNHLIAQSLLGSKDYMRLQFELNANNFNGKIDFLNDDMDDTRPKNIENLIEASRQYFEKFKANFFTATIQRYEVERQGQGTYDEPPNAFAAEVTAIQADFFERLKKETKDRNGLANGLVNPEPTERPFVFAGVGYPLNSQTEKTTSLKRQFIARVTKLRHLPSNVFIVFVAVMLLMGPS